MQTRLDCFPCFIRQTIIALNQVPDSRHLHRQVINEVLSIMQQADTTRPPAYITTFIHRTIRARLGTDPFEKVKYEYNNIALGLYPELKKKISQSKDPLWSAARLAIAGNVIDFGIFTSIDIEGSVRRALEEEIAVDDYAQFREDTGNADLILYLLDNAGEIVFDRLLIEELVKSGKKVRAVVKGSPVLNDATSDDAVQAGVAGVCDVVDNGSDAIGTILEWTSHGFQQEFSRAELVISKGQGNFETLVGFPKRTHFLFQSKCGVVSEELGLFPGAMLLKKS